MLLGNAHGSGVRRTCANTLGTLYVSCEKLLFVSVDKSLEVWLLYTLIDTVERKSLTLHGTPLHIRCKDFRQLRFVIPRQQDAQDVYDALQVFGFPGSYGTAGAAAEGSPLSPPLSRSPPPSRTSRRLSRATRK